MRRSTQKNEIFAARLIALRKRLQCTQQELGFKLGFSKNYIYMLEKGRTPGKKLVEQVRQLEQDIDKQESFNAQDHAVLEDLCITMESCIPMLRRNINVDLSLDMVDEKLKEAKAWHRAVAAGNLLGER